MPSIIPGYEYDIFISYRQSDNKRDGWVTEFVETLNDELEATVKVKLSIYFDENPHDGLLETHDVDDSLAKKLKCLIFVPIISKTYCDPNTFAWTNEFLAFNKLSENDEYGLKVTLPNGNMASRVLPIRIHDIDDTDRQLVEDEIGFLRSIDFVYQSAGVNRPLRPKDDDVIRDTSQTFYRDQINKVANAIQDIIAGLREAESPAVEAVASNETQTPTIKKTQLTSELKRRNVLRASLVYILAALVFWKVADISIGLLNLPGNTLQFITLALIVLFPIAMLMAWLYERSPQGFIKTGSTASRENPFTDAQKKPLTNNTFILVLVATVAALFLIFPQSDKQEVITDGVEVDKSIAVLPFVNMSGDPDQLYFSDGIMDAILNHLTKIKDLKVISRTSVMQYRDMKKTIPQIAQELGVAYILTGGVQRFEDQVRINAQLVEAQTDKQVWSENYDRKFTNIFAIQSEVAQQIANIMQATIDPEVKEQLESKPTENMEAYNLYLEASFILDNFFDLTKYPKAYELLEKAIVLDPDFALAYTSMADYWIAQGIFTGVLEMEKVVEEALPLLEKSLEIDDKEPVTHRLLAQIYLWFQWDFEKAEMEFNKIREFSTSNVIFPEYLLAAGRYQEALIESTKLIKNDRNNPTTWGIQGLCLYFNDHSEESLATFEQALKEFPNHPNLLSIAGRDFIFLNQYHEAIKILKPHLNKLDRRPPRDLGNLAIAYYKTNQNSKSSDILEELKQMSQESSVGSPAFYIAMLYAQMRETELAFEWLEKAYINHEVEMYWLKVEPPFEPLRSDHRWQEILDKVGFPD